LGQFSKAIQYIGDDNSGVRLGGVYLLAMLAERSAVHRYAVRDVLSSFVRSNSPWPPGSAMPAIGVGPHGLVELGASAPDIQGALNALGSNASLWNGSNTVRLSKCDR
jgi:hypothetical protein